MSMTLPGKAGARASQAEGRRGKGLEVGEIMAYLGNFSWVSMAGVEKVAD